MPTSWEDLTPAERKARLAKYDSEVKAEARSRLAAKAAAAKKPAAKVEKVDTSLMGAFKAVRQRRGKINQAVDDNS